MNTWCLDLWFLHRGPWQLYSCAENVVTCMKIKDKRSSTLAVSFLEERKNLESEMVSIARSGVSVSVDYHLFNIIMHVCMC